MAITQPPLSARYALNIPPQYLCSHSWHKTCVKGGSSQRESGWCTLASSNSVSMLPWLITLDPNSARYALITELSKTLKREILLHLSFWIYPCPKRRWISVSWSIDSLSARYALHPLACIAIDGGHRRVIRSRESESVKDCSWIENNPLSARYALLT